MAVSKTKKTKTTRTLPKRKRTRVAADDSPSMDRLAQIAVEQVKLSPSGARKQAVREDEIFNRLNNKKKIKK